MIKIKRLLAFSLFVIPSPLILMACASSPSVKQIPPSGNPDDGNFVPPTSNTPVIPIVIPTEYSDISIEGLQILIMNLFHRIDNQYNSLTEVKKGEQPSNYFLNTLLDTEFKNKFNNVVNNLASPNDSEVKIKNLYKKYEAKILNWNSILKNVAIKTWGKNSKDVQSLNFLNTHMHYQIHTLDNVKEGSAKYKEIEKEFIKTFRLINNVIDSIKVLLAQDNFSKDFEEFYTELKKLNAEINPKTSKTNLENLFLDFLTNLENIIFMKKTDGTNVVKDGIFNRFDQYAIEIKNQTIQPNSLKKILDQHMERWHTGYTDKIGETI